MEDIFFSEKPRSELLRKHIAYYYFHKSDAITPIKSFFYYAHYKNALTIYKNSSVYEDGTFGTITKPGQNGFFFGYTHLIKGAASAKIYSPFDKVGVTFQPLGLNSFIDDSLSILVHKPINLEFNYFKKSIERTLEKVFLTTDIEEKVTLLDNYFLSIYKGFNAAKLETAVNCLIKNDKKYTVEELAKELQINRKTLLRLFKEHLNCSVIDYIKLVQFRKAIDLFQTSYSQSSLTELAYDTDYYDQSEFINHFKKMTGFNPKSFFKNISKFGNQGTYWTFH